MEDLLQIRKLVDAYAIAMDLNDQAAFADLFAPDGELVVMVPGRDRPIGRFGCTGPDGVSLIAQLISELYVSTQHHITTHHATVQGDTATGVTYCLAYHVADGGYRGEVVESAGVKYDEQFIRTSVGWRIGLRKATRLWTQSSPISYEPLIIDRAAAARRAADTREGKPAGARGGARQKIVTKRPFVR